MPSSHPSIAEGALLNLACIPIRDQMPHRTIQAGRDIRRSVVQSPARSRLGHEVR